MIKLFKMLRKTKITKGEVIGDVIFVVISGFIAFLATFIFDIHHSFYSWPIFPLSFIFTDWQPYLYFTLIGSIGGFFLIKLFVLGIKEEMK